MTGLPQTSGIFLCLFLLIFLGSDVSIYQSDCEYVYLCHCVFLCRCICVSLTIIHDRPVSISISDFFTLPLSLTLSHSLSLSLSLSPHLSVQMCFPPQRCIFSAVGASKNSRHHQFLRFWLAKPQRHAILATRFHHRPSRPPLFDHPGVQN